LFRAAFHREHVLPFEFGEARVGQVERNGNARDAVGGEPLFGQPDVGAESEAFAIEFVQQTQGAVLKRRAADAQRQVA